MIKLKPLLTEGVENWELSTCQEQPSIVANGEYEGRTLLEYIEEQGQSVLGTKYDQNPKEPIWIRVVEDKITHCKDVNIEVIEIEEEAELLVDETSFNALVVLEGSSHILSSRKQMTLNKGDIIFLSAGYGTYCIVGMCKVMICRI